MSVDQANIRMLRALGKAATTKADFYRAKSEEAGVNPEAALSRINLALGFQSLAGTFSDAADDLQRQQDEGIGEDGRR